MKRRVRKDWVYRPAGHRLPDETVNAGQGLGAFEGLGASLGSYDRQVVTMATGVAASQARILYDSTNRIAVGMGSLDSETRTTTWFTRAARAEGKKARVFAVQGFLHCEPTTWTLGNVMAIGWRLGVYDQDPESGFIEVPTEYSMWENGSAGVGTPFATPAMWANDGRWVKEDRRIKVFSSGDEAPQMRIPIYWRSARGITLRGRESFALYLELGATAVQMRIQTWLRSLVSDEG